MKINIEKLKLEYIAEKIQVLLIDAHGLVAESCDSIFPFSIEKESIFAKIPFFESLSRILPDLRFDDAPLCFDKTEIDFAGKTCLCDVHISKKHFDERELFEVIIENKTLYYQFFDELQTHSKGDSNYLELLNEQISLRNEIERLRTEEKKRWLQQKRSFLFQVASQFEVPLANATAVAALIEQNPSQLSDWIKPLTATLQQIEDVRRFILDLASPSEILLRKEPLDLQQILQSLADSLSARLMFMVQIDLQIDKKLPNVLIGDAYKINQLFHYFCESLLQTNQQIKLTASVMTENKNEFFISFEVSGKLPAQNKNERWLWAEKVVESMGGKLKTTTVPEKISFFIPFAIFQENIVSNKKEKVLFLADGQADEKALELALQDAGFDVEQINAKILAEDSFFQNNKKAVLIVSDVKISDENLFQTLKNKFAPHFFVITQQANRFDDFFAVIKKPIHSQTVIRKIQQTYTVNYMEKIDLSYIRDIVDNQSELIVSMLRILEKNMREYPVLMHKELESGNLKALRETAHKFKSSTAYTGLTKFNATLNRIELCEEQTLTLDEVRALVDEIALASVQIREQVEELILQQDL